MYVAIAIQVREQIFRLLDPSPYMLILFPGPEEVVIQIMQNFKRGVDLDNTTDTELM